MKEREGLATVGAWKRLSLRVLPPDMTVEIVERCEGSFAERTGKGFRCIRIVSLQMLSQLVFFVEGPAAFAAAERSIFFVPK